MDIDVSAEKAPLKAQLRVGGGLPVAWVLYDYERNGDGWSRREVASGDGDAWVDLPHTDAAALKGHVLTWAVAAVDFDDEGTEVDVVVTVKGNGNSPGAEQKSKWLVSKTQPKAFISVRVVK